MPPVLKYQTSAMRGQRCRPGVQHVATRQFRGSRANLAGKFTVSNDRTCEGHCTDEDAKENLDPQDRNFHRIFFGQERGKTFQRLTLGIVHRHHTAKFDMCDKAHKNRRQTNERVHRGHQFGHLRHLNARCQNVTDNATTGDEDQRHPPETKTRADQRCGNRKGHADNAVPHGAFCAFLPRKATKRQNEEDGCDDVSRCCKTVIH